MAKISTKKVTGKVKSITKTAQGHSLVTVTPEGGGKDVAIEVIIDPIASALNLQVVYAVGDKVKYISSPASALEKSA